MKVDVVPLRQLSASLLDRWGALHASSVAPFDSPFYRPEFAAVIDGVRGDVEVAVVEQAGRVAAFLPFHRTRGRIGKPVGLHLNDFQGLIGRTDESIDVARVLSACGLQAWDFDHVPVQQSCFTGAVAIADPSPFVDFARGFEAYERERNEKSNDLRDLARRIRKLERDVGPIRAEHGIDDFGVLDQLLHWKRAQFYRTGVPDILSNGWVPDVVAEVARRKEASFCGILSGLWAGDRLLAAELQLGSGSVLHAQWFAYDPEYSRYSPGRMLNERCLRWAAENGITRYEYGKGDQEYKLRASTGQHLVGTGSVACGLIQRTVRGAWRSMRRWARTSRLRPQLKAAASYYFRLKNATHVLAKETA